MSESNYWARFARRQISRRRFVGGSVAAASMAFIGCSTSNKNKNVTSSNAAGTSAATTAPATQAATTAPAASATTAASTGTASAGGAVANLSYGKPSPDFQAHDMPKTRGGTWRQFSYDALPPDNLDPHQSNFGPEWGIWSMLFSKLISYDDPNNESIAPIWP